MASIVFVKGVNVGGHRTFRPSVLAQALSHLDVVHVGAAGTFVVRKTVKRADLRAEIQRRLPFAADVMICSSRDILRLVSADPFKGQVVDAATVHFVSLLGRRPPSVPRVPLNIPSEGSWCVRMLGRQGPFVFGLYRREMRTIRCLDRLEKLLVVPMTTRNWNTILSIVRLLNE